MVFSHGPDAIQVPIFLLSIPKTIRFLLFPNCALGQHDRGDLVPAKLSKLVDFHPKNEPFLVLSYPF